MKSFEKMKQFRGSYKFWLCIIVSTFMILCLYGYFITHESVDSWESKTIKKCNEEFQTEKGISCLQKSLDNCHITVTLRDVRIIGIKTYTKDGSTCAGYNGNNITHFTLYIRTIWDGWVHKRGTTDFAFDYTNHNGQIKFIKGVITESDALVRLDDPEWVMKMGFLMGALLAL